MRATKVAPDNVLGYKIMRKTSSIFQKMQIILIFCIFACLFSNSYGQVSIGPYTMFPDSKFLGSAYKPQLSIGKIDNQYILSLRYVSPNTYASFDEESVLLLRLGNDSIIKLSFAKELDFEKKYENSYSKYTGITHFYITYSYYWIDIDALNRIVKDKEVIKKIRASFTNGNFHDWEISDKYQVKLTERLIECFNSVESADSIRKEKMNNVESGV